MSRFPDKPLGRLLRRLVRRETLPWTLLGLGLVLAVGVGLGIVAGRDRGAPEGAPPSATSAPAPVPPTSAPETSAPPPPPPSPPTTAPPPPSPPTTAPPPPPPPATAPPPPPPPPAPTPPPAPAPAPTAPPAGFAIWDVRVDSLSAFAATVSWRTTEPALSWLAYGLAGGGATLWSGAGDVSTEHSATLSGLSAATSYTLSLSATASDETAQASLDLQTPSLPAQLSASTSGGVLLLDGQPFFPIMVWAQCPAGYEANLASGVNLFAANPCHGIQEQLGALAGRALSAAVSGEPDVQGPALVGWFYPDEPDANHVTAGSLATLPTTAGEVTFLTLSNHFYSGADPPSEGRWIYPSLIRRADVVGFDLYPLQGWCRTDRLGDVYDAQRELVRLARGRPTFQWIESSGMGCDYPPFSITPETVRAESWLAIAAGARGLGYFPPSPTPEVAQAIALVSREIRGLAPALLSPDAPVAVEPAGSPIRVGARAYGGALYVIAVNPTASSLRATIKAPGLEGRSLYVLDENRSMQASGDGFEDDFAPLAVHVYLAPPSGR